MSFSQWIQQLNFNMVLSEIVVVAAALLCITFHETCHGLVAYWLGDPTAKNAGRLTLNPLRHVDMIGLIMIAIFRFGWAKPVPVDMRRFKNPKRGMAITALAGPASNIVLAFVALIFRGIFLVLANQVQSSIAAELLNWVTEFFEATAIISTGLAIFNLIPISPLDGSKVLFAFLPNQAYEKLMRYERYGMLLLMVILFTGVLDTPLIYARTALLNGMNALALWPARWLLMWMG